MAWVRCPMCTHAFRAQAGPEQVCPACGHRARVAANVGEVQDPAALDPLPADVVGKPRRTSGFIGLSLVTLGIYGIVWWHRVFREVDRQHGRYHLIQYYILGLVPVLNLVFAPMYVFGEMAKLRAFRRAHGLKSGPGGVTVMVWLWLALLVTGAASALIVLQANGADTPIADVSQDAKTFLDDSEFRADNKWARSAWVEDVLLVGIPAGLVGLVLCAIATGVANHSLKGLWKAVYAEKGVAWPWGGWDEEPSAEPVQDDASWAEAQR